MTQAWACNFLLFLGGVRGLSAFLSCLHLLWGTSPFRGRFIFVFLFGFILIFWSLFFLSLYLGSLWFLRLSFSLGKFSFLELSSKIVNFHHKEGCRTRKWVEFCQKYIDAIRHSLATVYDTWWHCRFSNNQRQKNYLRYTWTHRLFSISSACKICSLVFKFMQSYDLFSNFLKHFNAIWVSILECFKMSKNPSKTRYVHKFHKAFHCCNMKYVKSSKSFEIKTLKSFKESISFWNVLKQPTEDHDYNGGGGSVQKNWPKCRLKKEIITPRIG